jgi:hypothetical protein
MCALEFIYDGMNWPNFGTCFVYLPNLQDFELSIWWDEPWEFGRQTEPGVVDEPIGTLDSYSEIKHLSLDLGLLVQSFFGRCNDCTCPTTVIITTAHVAKPHSYQRQHGVPGSDR